MLWRVFIGIAALLSLTACTSDLDDPIGVKKRRAEARRAECSQIYGIKQASYEQGVATYAQDVFFSDTKLTQEGMLKRAEDHLDTARALETLELGDKNLRLLNTYLAESFRHRAKKSRDLAPFAEVERTITSANERSSAHQAIVARANPYDGLDYALEVYCEGGKMPSAYPENSVEQ
ncbi:MAG: hypothetical protein AAFU84_14965 [Cyanobacteria bacterium J06633_23]